ncbi:MAG TPA: pyridoxamine 5'-phosphate oxidase family protein [Ktedonobacterales bacterium]|nr:pyridoxamine 5'-phosphate oxidase family protein [Ktedonobacterales bacterium]
MKTDDPTVIDVLRRSMVARIATLSHNGRPSITPLYFVHLTGRIWLGTPAWTLAARHVTADPRVSLLFHVERDASDQRVVRISGRARVRTDRQARRSYALRAARKYVLTLGDVRDTLVHLRLLPIRRHYRAQSAAKGQSSVIEVIPERVEILIDEKGG